MRTPKIILSILGILALTALAFAWKNSTLPPIQKTIVSVEPEKVNPEVTESIEMPVSDELATTTENTKSLEETNREIKALFPDFSAQFSEIKLPFVIDEETMAKYRIDGGRAKSNQEKVIDEKYKLILPEMEQHLFGRESYDETYQYVAKLKETDDYTLVAFAYGSDHFGGYYSTGMTIASFDKDGKRIDQTTIAYSGAYGNEYQSATINTDLSISATIYEKMYKKDPSEFGYENNPVVSQKVTKQIMYTIDKGGKIISSEDVSNEKNSAKI